MAYGFNEDKSKATIKTETVQYTFYPIENIQNGSYGRLDGTRTVSKTEEVISINGVDFHEYAKNIEDPNIISMERTEEGSRTIQRIRVYAKNATGGTLTTSTRCTAIASQTIIN